jgi:hypothetical protein
LQREADREQQLHPRFGRLVGEIHGLLRGLERRVHVFHLVVRHGEQVVRRRVRRLRRLEPLVQVLDHFRPALLGKVELGDLEADAPLVLRSERVLGERLLEQVARSGGIALAVDHEGLHAVDLRALEGLTPLTRSCASSAAACRTSGLQELERLREALARTLSTVLDLLPLLVLLLLPQRFGSGFFASVLAAPSAGAPP